MKKILLFFVILLLITNSVLAQSGWDDTPTETKKVDVKKQSVVSDPVAEYPLWNSVPVFTPVKAKGTGVAAQMRTGIIAPGTYSKVHAISFKVIVGYDENKRPIYGIDNSMSVMFTENVAFKEPTRVTVMCWANPGDEQPTIWGN